MISRRRFLGGLASTAVWPSVGEAADFNRDQYQSRMFTAGGIRHEVLTAHPRGGSGPDVIVLHEISGASDLFFTYTDTLVNDGFTVHCPVLFGSKFVRASKLQTLAYAAKACWPTSEFECRTLSADSAINPWLVALAADIAKVGRPLGVIGMCLTGVQPLVMLRCRAVVAPVLCQPTLPIGRDSARAEDLGVPPADADFALARVHDEQLKLLLIRYQHDTTSSEPRARRLTRLFHPHMKFVPVPGHDHSSLVHDPHPQAKAEVIDFLRRQLKRT